MREKHKQSGVAAEVTEEVETKSISAGEMAGLFQVMAAVSKRLKMNHHVPSSSWMQACPPQGITIHLVSAHHQLPGGIQPHSRHWQTRGARPVASDLNSCTPWG